ncbi:hypothetical protein [Microbulbifer sp. THAF38]|uniref:phage adaptor protein n=1 Tax=Microbulbifer sp. THAF38 TaxID=2587856 RepID=UPI00126976ED|nr:hypothetical protein [Microbulbifer sp. THAF38]QFT55579.1 hypothetical protein FIU95_13575 [Microbulbifer sp. THAF38]
MAITNYGELKTAVAEWVNREDDDEILARVPDFIRMAEARIYRELRCPANEATVASDSYSTSAGAPLPADYLEMRSVRWDGIVLDRISDRDNRQYLAGETPRYFARRGSYLRLYPTPSSAGELELNYWQDQSGLSADSDTCNVLAVAPDLYLYASLIEAEPFLENEARLPLWQHKYQQALEQIQDMAERDELSGGVMAVRSAY